MMAEAARVDELLQAVPLSTCLVALAMARAPLQTSSLREEIAKLGE